jgi:hypothetical protein
MDVSFLPNYIFFTAVALSVSAIYLAVTALAAIVRNLIGLFRPAHPISRRPGEVIHQALKITGRLWIRYKTAAILFVTSFFLLLLFGRHDWWANMSLAIHVLIAAALLAITGFGTLRLVQLSWYRRKLSHLLDTHIAVSQRLIEAQMRGNRVYYSVPIGPTMIDNLVVGKNGVYAIQLFPPPDEHCNSVSAHAGGLIFQPGNLQVDTRIYVQQVNSLSQVLSEFVGSRITVLPVIIVPDCTIRESSIDRPLICSTESCTAFIGWKDPSAFLMDEDIVEISRLLSTLESEEPLYSFDALKGVLDTQIERPKFV